MNEKPDQLTLDVIQCMKDGYGVHYGAWKANHPKKDPPKVQDGYCHCASCGKLFKKKRPNNIYCCDRCRRRGQTGKKQKRRISDV